MCVSLFNNIEVGSNAYKLRENKREYPCVSLGLTKSNTSKTTQNLIKCIKLFTRAKFLVTTLVIITIKRPNSSLGE